MPRDAKQYRYHERFERSAKAPNMKHVVELAEALPAIRAKVREHMALRGLPREKVLATIVHLLETILIWVGNDDYAKQNNSYGLTTLKTRHCECYWQKRQTMVAACKRSTDRQDHQGMSGPSRPGAAAVLGRRGTAAGRDLKRRRPLPERNHWRKHHGEGFSDMGGHGAGRNGVE